MTTMDARAAATTYFAAWPAKDFATLRGLLADDATFRGPLGTADSAEECVRGLTGMAELITDIVIEKMVVDGPDVLTWFQLHTAAAEPIPTVNWSHLDDDGRISRIRVVFDPRPLLG